MGCKIHKNRDAIHFSNRAKLQFYNLKDCDQRLHALFSRNQLTWSIFMAWGEISAPMGNTSMHLPFLVIILIRTPSRLQKSQ